MLHGLGADGQDLIGLAQNFAPTLPGAVFHAPDAPFPCDMAPMGRQWFSLQQIDPDYTNQGVEQALPSLNHFLDHHLRALNIKEDRLILMGFSQGGLMAVHCALRRRTAPAAVISFSGAFVTGHHLCHNTYSKPPILLIHGDQDNVVPLVASAQAYEILQQSGHQVELITRPGLAHGIDGEALDHARKFLNSVI